MRALLLYCTGTFHTRYLTLKIKERLLQAGYETVQCFEVNQDSPEIPLESYDLVGIGYPIYAFNSPRTLNKYLKKLTFPTKTTYFIYKQSGESMHWNNCSSRVIKKLLKKQGCSPLIEEHFLFPYNIHFRFEDSFVKQLLDYDKKLLDLLIHEITEHVPHQIKASLLDRICSYIFTIQRIGGPINGPLYKVDQKKCDSCHLCVKLCPNHNIEVKNDNTLTFHSHCEMCMRCSFLCPKDAISIGFLNGWKVNHPYPLDKIDKDNTIKGDYIKGGEKGFYSCYHKTIEEVNERHLKLMSEKGENV